MVLSDVESCGFVPIPLPVEAGVVGQAGCGAGVVAVPVFEIRLLWSMPALEVAAEDILGKVAVGCEGVEKRLSGALVVNPVADAGVVDELSAGLRAEVVAAELRPGSVTRADWLAGVIAPEEGSGVLVMVRP